MEYYSLDEIYDRAIDAGFLSPELKAKDAAMWQAAEVMRSMNQYDDNEDFDEDEIFKYAQMHGLRFDVNGNIV